MFLSSYVFGVLGDFVGSIKVNVSDDVEKRFRMLAIRLFGYGKGALSVAAEKAFSEWVARVSEVWRLLGFWMILLM